jgi:hypothetical protein
LGAFVSLDSDDMVSVLFGNPKWTFPIDSKAARRPVRQASSLRTSALSYQGKAVKVASGPFGVTPISAQS